MGTCDIESLNIGKLSQSDLTDCFKLSFGSLIFWSLDNEEYSSDLFKHDMLNIAYLLIQLEQISHFAENERVKFNFQLQKQQSSS